MDGGGQLHAPAIWIAEDRRLGGPRTRLDTIDKVKIPAPSGNRTPVLQPLV
jgi:hypothetical protein